MTGNKFKTVSIKQAEQGGGSGLFLRFPAELHLIECHFEDTEVDRDGGALMFDQGTKFVFNGCTFVNTKAKTNGGAITLRPTSESVSIIGCWFRDNSVRGWQTGSGGFLFFGANPGNLEIVDTTFKNSVAANGGCIYTTAESVTSFTIDNVTVDACGSSADGHSLVVPSTKTSLSELHLLNMPGVMGRLQLHATMTEIVLYGCQFKNFGMRQLFDGATNWNFPVNLTDCHFETVTIEQGNLIKFTNGNTHKLVMSGCVFKDVTADWALVSWATEAQSVECLIEGCRFENVVVEYSTEQEKKAEPILLLRRISVISLTNVNFIGGELKNGPLVIDSSDCTITLDGVHFENCNIARPDPSADHPYPCFFIYQGTIEKMNDCTFVSCHYSTGDQSILKIGSAVTIQSSVSVSFDGCGTTTPNLVGFGPSALTFETCAFKNMELTAPVVRFESSTSTELMFKNVEFSNVRMTETVTNLLGFAISPTRIEFDNVRVEQCALAKLGDVASASIVFQGSHFRQNTVHSRVLEINNQGSTVELWDCDFDNCACESSMIQLTGCSTVNISVTSFADCSCKSGALVTIADAGFVFIGSSCFQGLPERADGPGYIDCTCENATFELPICFSLGEEASISFKGCPSPLLNISNPSAIFNCSDCSFIPTEEPEPLDSEEMTSFTDSFTDSFIDSSPLPPPEDSGLGGGAIAGIVVGVLVFIGVIIALIILFIVFRRRKSEDKSIDDEPSEMNEEAETTTITSVIDEWNQRVTEDGPESTNDTVSFHNDTAQDAFIMNSFEEAFA